MTLICNLHHATGAWPAFDRFYYAKTGTQIFKILSGQSEQQLRLTG